MATAAFTRIGLVAKLHLQNKDEVLRPIITVLKSCGGEVFFDSHTIGDLPCTKDIAPIVNVADLDLLVVVGGDGTILRAIRELKPENVPVLAINAGSVGFLSELPLADVASKLPGLLEGNASIERRSCLNAEVFRGDECIFQCVALNDAVISQGTISRLLNLKALIADDFLATYHADGLIVSTPTGSTAYSLAAGGPVVHPTISALILTPINPHSFTQKPIVIPGDAPVEVTIAREDVPAFADTTVGLTIDGQVYHALQAGDRIVMRTGMTAQFVRANADAFYRALRTKLKWGEGLDVQ